MGKGWKGRAELGEFSIRNNGATPDLTCVTLIHISLASVCIITTNINMIESKCFYVKRDINKELTTNR